MAKYAATTEVPVEKSKAEIEKIVRRYGADGFMSAWEGSRATVQFKCQLRHIRFIMTLPDPREERFTHFARHGYKHIRTDSSAHYLWEQGLPAKVARAPVACSSQTGGFRRGNSLAGGIVFCRYRRSGYWKDRLRNRPRALGLGLFGREERPAAARCGRLELTVNHSLTEAQEMQRCRDAAVRDAEAKIAAILFALEEETGMSIDHVNVDTRNYGQLATEIFLTKRMRR